MGEVALERDVLRLGQTANSDVAVKERSVEIEKHRSNHSVKPFALGAFTLHTYPERIGSRTALFQRWIVASYELPAGRLVCVAQIGYDDDREGHDSSGPQNTAGKLVDRTRRRRNGKSGRSWPGFR